MKVWDKSCKNTVYTYPERIKISAAQYDKEKRLVYIDLYKMGGIRMKLGISVRDAGDFGRWLVQVSDGLQEKS